MNTGSLVVYAANASVFATLGYVLCGVLSRRRAETVEADVFRPDVLRVPTQLTGLRIDERYAQMPPIDYALPLIFSNQSIVDEVTLTCPRCQRNIGIEQTRGEFLRIDFGYQLRSVSHCRCCNLYFWGRCYVLETNDDHLIVSPPRAHPGSTDQSPWPGDPPVRAGDRFPPPVETERER